MENYKIVKLSKHLYRIIDLTGVCCYLVIGKDKACLLDTCCGYGDLKSVVSKITDKPVFVILTHGHFDHTGAAAQYEKVYMNLNDMPVLKKHSMVEIKDADIKNHTKELKHLSKEDWIEPYKQVPINIEDGDIFDLGELTIKMILVKGHTPGMMCPLIVEDRIIIFGDACGVGVLLFDEFSSYISEYRESLIRLKEYEDDYDTIYRNHGTFSSPKELLDNVIECCDLILSGNDAKQPVEMHGFNLYSAQRTQGYGRADGKEGNVIYAIDKVK